LHFRASALQCCSRTSRLCNCKCFSGCFTKKHLRERKRYSPYAEASVECLAHGRAS
jgi:hypothetical protein